MKITKGDVTIECTASEAQAALDLILGGREALPELTPWGEAELLAEEEHAASIPPGIHLRQVHRKTKGLQPVQKTRKSNPTAALSKVQLETWKALDEYDQASFAQIAFELDISEGAANQRLNKLCKKKAIYRVGAGIFSTVRP